MQGGNVPFPLSLIFEPTFKCNLHCPMCYLKGLKSIEVPWEDMKRALIPAIKRIKEFYVVGAEPFLYKDLYRALWDVKNYGIKTGVQTNGTIHKFEIFEVLDRFDTSIDGTEGFHDTIRGKGSFKKTMKSIEKALEKGIMGTVSITALDGNIDSIYDVVFILFDIGVKRIDISPVVLWEGESETMPLMPYGKYSKEFVERFKELVRGLKDIPGVTFSPEWVSQHPDIFFNGSAKRVFCGHFHAMRIQPDGTVVHCHHIRKPIGNILNEDIISLWYGKMRRFREGLVKRGFYPFCKRCCRSLIP